MVHEISADWVGLVASTGYLQPANVEVALSDDFLQPGRRPEHAAFFNTSVALDAVPPLIDTLPELEDAVAPSLEQLVYGVGVLDLDALTTQIDDESKTVLDPESASESPARRSHAFRSYVPRWLRKDEVAASKPAASGSHRLGAAGRRARPRPRPSPRPGLTARRTTPTGGYLPPTGVGGAHDPLERSDVTPTCERPPRCCCSLALMLAASSCADDEQRATAMPTTVAPTTEAPTTVAPCDGR